MKKYLKILACLYFLGGVLHILDLFDLRLKFSGLETYWKIWIIYLCIMDLITAVGLWGFKRWGVYCFLIVAASQLIAYIGFQKYFGNQFSLIVFHLLTVLIFMIMRSEKIRNKTQS